MGAKFKLPVFTRISDKERKQQAVRQRGKPRAVITKAERLKRNKKQKLAKKNRKRNRR